MRCAVFALHSRRAKPLRDYRLLRVLAISRRLFGHVICESADVGWNFPTKRDRPWLWNKEGGTERESERKRENRRRVGRGARGRAKRNGECGRRQGNDGNGNYFPFSACNCSTHEVTAFEHCAFRGLIKSFAERSPNKYLATFSNAEGEREDRRSRENGNGKIENKFDHRPRTFETLSLSLSLFLSRSLLPHFVSRVELLLADSMDLQIFHGRKSPSLWHNREEDNYELREGVC